MVTHAKKNVACPGCSRRFSTNSVLILRLEAGTGVSNVDLDEINQLALECYHAQNYESNNLDFDFECSNCQTLFSFMSGLLQHAESDDCDEVLERGSQLSIFIYFVRSRIIWKMYWITTTHLIIGQNVILEGMLKLSRWILANPILNTLQLYCNN